MLLAPTHSKSICAQCSSHTHTHAPAHAHTHTHTHPRSKSQIAMHCQVEPGQYYNSRSVGEGLCEVIHFKSAECSYRWRSPWMKCVLCPSVFTHTRGTWESWFNTKECLRTLTPPPRNNPRCQSIWYSKVWIQLKGCQLKALRPFLCQKLRTLWQREIFCSERRPFSSEFSSRLWVKPFSPISAGSFCFFILLSFCLQSEVFLEMFSFGYTRTFIVWF